MELLVILCGVLRCKYIHKYVLKFQRALLAVGEYLFKEKAVFVSHFIFLESSVLQCTFWKIWTDNNCNFTGVDHVFLFRSWLFSAVPAMLRRISSNRLGFPADVQTSGDFLCC